MRLVFISGQGRSGTTLLKDMLDGHPQVAVWPNEWQYLTLYKKYVDEDLNKKFSQEYILDKITKDNKKFLPVFEGSISDWRLDKESPVLDELNPDFSIKLLTYKDQCVDARSFYDFIASSYKWLDSQKVFCNKCNDPLNIIEYVKYFRKSKFIFIIRDPLESYNSKIKHRFKGYPLNWKGPFDIFKTSFFEIKEFFGAIRNILQDDELASHVIIIRMEDLLDDTENILREICVFIGIEFNDSLRNPTFLGKPVPGHLSGGGRQFTLLSSEDTLDKSLSLTKEEKRWFMEYADNYIKYYPFILDKTMKAKRTSLFGRSYKYIRRIKRYSTFRFLIEYCKMKNMKISV